MSKIKERGYYELKFNGGSKWMHFSMTSLKLLKEISGDDYAAFGMRLLKEDKTPEEGFDLACILAHSGLNAYDLENNIEIDYNEHQIANWVWEAMQNDEKVIVNISEALVSALPKIDKKVGKQQGVKQK